MAPRKQLEQDSQPSRHRWEEGCRVQAEEAGPPSAPGRVDGSVATSGGQHADTAVEGTAQSTADLAAMPDGSASGHGAGKLSLSTSLV